MALADANNTAHASVLEMEPGERARCARRCHCDMAIEALDRALHAITRDDIEGRCDAVRAATEATTALFLEFDAMSLGCLAQSPGQLYESILARLIGINLRNEPSEARVTITMIERLRNVCAPSSGKAWQRAGTAAHRSDP